MDDEVRRGMVGYALAMTKQRLKAEIAKLFWYDFTVIVKNGYIGTPVNNSRGIGPDDEHGQRSVTGRVDVLPRRVLFSIKAIVKFGDDPVHVVRHEHRHVQVFAAIHERFGVDGVRHAMDRINADGLTDEPSRLEVDANRFMLGEDRPWDLDAVVEYYGAP